MLEVKFHEVTRSKCQRKTLTVEFKRECAELFIIHGYKNKDSAAEMNIGLSSIQRWVSLYRKELQGVTLKASALI